MDIPNSFAEFISEAPRVKSVSSRIRRVRVRIRGGKVQRNVKSSNVQGFTYRGGRLQRMSATEKRHRKMGARRAKIKRRASKARALIKRRRSLRRLHALMGK
jgi:hypothetical protein